ncbi:hypothetical protein BD626DRAFT_513667 [Schizophyllum amplum]|uniref:Uncharacterized protein n=1 Tax=Schizophyllum amplum TaxID=97359 RepID=A0A550BZC6_9AGAR|nr:hypothetical protein BD626DRAFT_513667 [Auriculariopsis ampla]
MSFIACDYVRTHRSSIVKGAPNMWRNPDTTASAPLGLNYAICVNFLGARLQHEEVKTYASYDGRPSSIYLSAKWMEGEEERKRIVRIIPYDTFDEETLERVTLYTPGSRLSLYLPAEGAVD